MVERPADERTKLRPSQRLELGLSAGALRDAVWLLEHSEDIKQDDDGDRDPQQP
jgi:hypothetical protein